MEFTVCDTKSDPDEGTFLDQTLLWPNYNFYQQRIWSYNVYAKKILLANIWVRGNLRKLSMI